uniref:UPF0057-domain-containing protein n=1 Tax=Angiostrongylus cantonensis TaxID=6313 RepID=A0A0K0DM70_ANGCA
MGLCLTVAKTSWLWAHSIVLIILATVPPLAVLFDQGCTEQFWINLLLTFLVFIPGIIHAWWVLLCREDLLVIVYAYLPTS